MGGKLICTRLRVAGLEAERGFVAEQGGSPMNGTGLPGILGTIRTSTRKI